MSLELQESISSFVDDELDGIDSEALISQLREDEEHKQVLGRYCVMSDAIKKSLPETCSHNLFERVQLALEDEPALLAPVPSHIENELPEAEIVELPKNTAKTTFKPAFGFGIAASLTLAVVLGFQINTQTDNLTQQAEVAPSIVPATQQFNIASKPAVSSTTVSFSNKEMKTEVGDATYAEQSLIDNERWTRITQIDGIPLANHFLSGRTEAHVQYKLQGNKQSLARSVNLEKSSTE